MSLFDRIKKLVRTDHLTSWPVDERIALIRLLYAACAVDGVYSKDEQEWMQSIMQETGISLVQIERMEISEAVRLLHSEPSKAKQLYPLLAEALFADGDFDRPEKDFVNRLYEQGLLRDNLEPAIKHVRDRILDTALSDWNQNIKNHR